ncbi:MAG: hypothetical protein A2Y00_05745 [Omnitrophica WOR_2 bacterium GWF2_43_52]|nr:MAG: hypothetical protein A2062_04630 [Omnitrophica WOR_2 bacterium GWA2_44_7]OGX16507.1 MAG: hypothetical protein A2Y01_00170 [Omnitrophica WOR_2 bacterium GWC2_44_8]OGX20601.1 MAG: hypothetical protein A2Y00_05745 [Omnitrophica WOR_2 bacterium GWF2_43_52]HAH21580.1 DUF192 domain-containing protein [Candidatus Omnitrophota bacterium]HBG64175.1 DUF192 domain-containing protein [Candidatus Omnitrophota bacterium]
MKIINKTRDVLLAEHAVIADKPFVRMKGLLGKKQLLDKHALVLKPCNSIHTFFMRFAIDVLFLDRQNNIVKMYASLKPWRLSGIFPSAFFCIELPSGVINKTHTCIGDQVFLE